jgi:tRNA threonylcarbamoyladenosine biosynthesis protein TsaB
MLLAFDTATPAVTVALHDGAHVVAESTVVDKRRHGELLAPGIEWVLREAGAARRDVTRVAVGVGPGPFTGLRVGIVTARTLALVLGVPVDGVCTLDVLAADVAVDGSFVVATDARRKQVYWAGYSSPYARVEGPAVDRPADVATPQPTAGEGARLYPQAFPRPVPPVHPSAARLAELVAGEQVVLLPPEPLYLRRPDAVEPGARKRVL